MGEPTGAMGAAIGFVSDQFQELGHTTDHFTALLQQSLDQMASIKVTPVNPPIRPDAPVAAVPVFQLDNAPVFAPVPMVQPDAPQAPNIDDLLSALDIGDMEEFPDAPPMIALNLPDAPGFISLEAPTRPDIDTTVILPTEPVIAMPEMEELLKITLPEFVYPVLEDFSGQQPTFTATVPETFINWAEPHYASEVLDELQTKVMEMMAGGTGLPPAIEDALFSRARERDSAETNRAVQEAVDGWAARDFSMPPGMLVKQTNVIREQGRLKAAETNRDIMVQAAQWEIENLRFAVQQGMALEQLTENLFENTTKRLFEVALFTAESQISVFNARISLFNAQNSAFATTVQLYRTKLDAALSKLQAYKTAIDGQVALGQINQQKVEVFKARLETVRTSVELFKAQMDGAKVHADVIASQFDAYKADVQAYAEQVGAEKVKFDAYDSQVRGETSKANMLDAQARAYASTIQGISNKADIRAKAAQIKMEAARTKVAKFVADVDAYKANVDAALKQVSYGTQVYQSQVEGWKATASANVAASEVQSRFADMNTRTAIAYAEMQISEYQATIQNAVHQAQIALEAAKAMGQYSAQLAAGALSAMHVSASVSGSGSASDSFSQSNSTGTTTSYNYTY